MISNYWLQRDLTEKEKRELLKLGSEIEIYSDIEKKEMEELGYKFNNPVQIHDERCIIEVKIGYFDLNCFVEPTPIPATKKNREIIRKIEEILFPTKK